MKSSSKKKILWKFFTVTLLELPLDGYRILSTGLVQVGQGNVTTGKNFLTRRKQVESGKWLKSVMELLERKESTMGTSVGHRPRERGENAVFFVKTTLFRKKDKVHHKGKNM